MRTEAEVWARGFGAAEIHRGRSREMWKGPEWQALGGKTQSVGNGTACWHLPTVLPLGQLC